MIRKGKPLFDPKAFLSKVNGGRAIPDYRKDQITSSARAMSFTNGCIFDLHQCRGSQT